MTCDFPSGVMRYTWAGLPAAAYADEGDPIVYMSVLLLVAVVTFMATYLPARRATHIDPAVALRTE